MQRTWTLGNHLVHQNDPHQNRWISGVQKNAMPGFSEHAKQLYFHQLWGIIDLKNFISSFQAERHARDWRAVHRNRKMPRLLLHFAIVCRQLGEAQNPRVMMNWTFQRTISQDAVAHRKPGRGSQAHQRQRPRRGIGLEPGPGPRFPRHPGNQIPCSCSRTPRKHRTVAYLHPIRWSPTRKMMTISPRTLHHRILLPLNVQTALVNHVLYEYELCGMPFPL